MLTLGILAAIIRNPTMMQELESGYADYARLNEALPTPLPIDPPYADRAHSLNYREYFFFLFLRMSSFSFLSLSLSLNLNSELMNRISHPV